MTEVRDGIVATVLLLLGLAAMAGDLAGMPTVRAVAAATGASPAPKVFSVANGLETFSTRFSLEWTDPTGRAISIALTPSLYAHVRGPYNRRNVYGAALAYAPVLAADARTREMFWQVLRFALCGRAPLLREVGLDPGAMRGPVTVRLEPERPETLPQDLPLTFPVECP